MICGQVRYEKSLHHEEIGCYYEGKPAGYLERAPKGGIPVVDPWYCDSPFCRQKVMFVLTWGLVYLSECGFYIDKVPNHYHVKAMLIYSLIMRSCNYQVEWLILVAHQHMLSLQGNLLRKPNRDEKLIVILLSK